MLDILNKPCDGRGTDILAGSHETYPFQNTTSDCTTINHLPPVFPSVSTVTQLTSTCVTAVPRLTTTVTKPKYITITEVSTLIVSYPTTITELNYTTISTSTTVTLPPNTTTRYSSFITTTTLPPNTTTTTDYTTLYSSIITTVTPTFNPCPTTCSM